VSNYGTCRSCGSQVLWAKSAAKGKPMPLERAPGDGNVALNEFDRAVVFRDHEAALEAIDTRDDLPLGETYVSHHARCPAGQRWSGKTREDAGAPAPNAEPAQGTLL
jgi:hypothetical protein